MKKVIAVVNQKGGVGKTTTTLNMGYCLADMGKKVLIVDLDPQGSLTVCMGIDEPDDIRYSIASLMMSAINDDETAEDIEAYIIKGEVDLIPGNIELSAVDSQLMNAMSRETVLKGILEDVRNKYDYVIIDCSPSLNLLTINALAAAEGVIIPVTSSYLSAQGLQILLGSIKKIQKKINPGLEIMGIVFTMYTERFNSTQEIEEMVASDYGKSIHIYDSKVPRSVAVEDGILDSKAVVRYSKKNRVSLAYRSLTKEVIENE